jgi:hypothetical protein
MRALAGNWQVSGIVKVQSGEWLTPTAGTNTARRSGRGQERANQILPDPYAMNKGDKEHWLNRAAYAEPPAGEWGSAPQVQGPGFFTIDMGLTRTFQLAEGQSVQFRAEAFNVLNHLNPENPSVNLRNSFFGQIRGARDPRIMQLALKYVF